MRVFLLLFALVLAGPGVVGTDPDVGATIAQLVESKGFTLETHHTDTEDGCQLTLHRVGVAGRNVNDSGRPVLLQHGILDASTTWVLNFPNSSLAFILATAGFDVWLGNIRGNTYSTGIRKYSRSSSKYWKWTWDEMGRYDMPAQLKYIQSTTGTESVPVVCHSQGCQQTLSAMTVSELDSFWRRSVPLLVGLAPVTFLGHQSSLLLKAMATLPLPKLLELIGCDDFFPDSAFLQKLLPDLCRNSPGLCDSVLWLITGTNVTHVNQTRLPVYLSHFPSGTSTFNIGHDVQFIQQEMFHSRDVYRRYDYDWFSPLSILGHDNNMHHYGQLTPPPFNISEGVYDGRPEGSVRLALYAGADDTLATYADVDRFVSMLPAPPEVYRKLAAYGHVDFVWGETANADLYPDILKLLRTVTYLKKQR